MLLQANMVKRITASGGGDLEAKAGESLLLKSIEVVPSTDDTYLTVSVDRVTVAYYRIKGKSGNQLSSIVAGYLKGNIMQYLAVKGINVSIPVAEGQVLNVSRYAQTGNVILLYDRYSAGDIKAEMPNGSAARIYTFLQYASIGTTPTAAGDHKLDTALTPAEFPDFPCGKTVPANAQIEILGIAGTPYVKAVSAGNNFATTFLKLIREREVLFDTDRAGIPFDGQDAAATELVYNSNYSLIGAEAESYIPTATVLSGHPLLFEPALKFQAGEELNAYLTLVKNGTVTYEAEIEDVAFILKVTKR